MICQQNTLKSISLVIWFMVHDDTMSCLKNVILNFHKRKWAKSQMAFEKCKTFEEYFFGGAFFLFFWFLGEIKNGCEFFYNRVFFLGKLPKFATFGGEKVATAIFRL